MPTYEYACTECGQHVEVVQSMSDAPLRTCGACGGRLRKVFAPIGIVFKGSGFYRTDSRSKSGAGKAAATSGAPDAGGKRAGGADKSAGGADKGASTSTSSRDGAAGSAKAGEKSA
jgi:putative FmdB family regulatory protein